MFDHFLLSETLFNESVDSFSVLHDIDNLSDHKPIILGLRFNVHCLGFLERIYTPQVSWVKATETNLQEYSEVLSRLLKSVYIPVDALLCKDPSCKNLVHLQHLNEYASKITDSCLRAAEAAIPCSCRRQSSGRIPGWSEYVQPVREKSLFWHKLRLECILPKTGAVADCKRRTRAVYHYAIRKVKRDEDTLINERIADSILKNDTRDFWSEIKRIRSNKSCTSRIVYGETDSVSIAKLFANSYRELYTSVPHDSDEMIINDEVEDIIAKNCGR